MEKSKTESKKQHWKLTIQKYSPKGVLLMLALIFGYGLCWHGLTLHKFGFFGRYGVSIFYDQYHVRRHLIEGQNIRGEWKYHIVSGYYDFRKILEQAGYDIYVHRYGRLRPGMLDGYDIYFIGEHNHQGTVMNEAERRVVMDYIKNGGSMWATAEHTNVHNVGENFNKLMAGTGVTARYDSICGYNGTVNSRDWVAIRDWKEHPITKGLSEIYFFNGCSFDTKFGIAFSSKDSWSDKWNADNPPTHNGNNEYDEGELKGPLTALTALNFGKGKIATTCDHNPFSNPSLHMGSNRELLLNAMQWLSKPKYNKSIYYLGALLLGVIAVFIAAGRFRIAKFYIIAAFIGAGIIVGAVVFKQYYKQEHRVLFAEINEPSTTARNKEPDGLWNFFGYILKNDTIELWLKNEILDGYDDLAVIAPTKRLTDAQLAQIDRYLNDGKSLIYVATLASLKSDAGRQLMDRYGFKMSVEYAYNRNSQFRTLSLKGPSEMRGGIERIAILGNIPTTRIEGFGWEVVLEATNKDIALDIVSQKKVGQGRVVVISPADIFMSKNGGLYKDKLDFVDIIMGIGKWIEDT